MSSGANRGWWSAASGAAVVFAAGIVTAQLGPGQPNPGGMQVFPGMGQPSGAVQPGGFKPPRRGHFEGGTFYYDEPEPAAPMGGFAGGGFGGGLQGPGMRVPGSGFTPKRPGHFAGGKFIYDSPESQMAPTGPVKVVSNPDGKVRTVGGDGDIQTDMAEDVRQLLNPLTTPGTARELLAKVTALGLEAIPFLAPHLDNTLRYGDDQMFQGFDPPRTRGAITVGSREATVGQVAALVAYHAVRPRTPSPYERTVPGKHHVMFVVKDYRAFYTRHAGRTAADIAEEMGGYVDRYFQQAGNPPVVTP